MSRRDSTSRLIEQLRRACSMELATRTALDPLAAGDADVAMRGIVRTHRRRAHEHRERLLDRLRALGAIAPSGRQAGASILAAARSLARDDVSHDERVRRAVLTKQLEIATYEAVERLAERAGDDATAEVARDARADDEELVRRLLRRLRARPGAGPGGRAGLSD